MSSFVDSLITPFDEELFKKDRNKDMILCPEKGKYYYYTAWPTLDKVSNLTKDTFLVNNKFAYAGKYVRQVTMCGISFLAFQNYGKEVLIAMKTSAFYKVKSEDDLIQLPAATKLELVCNAQEGRHYYATNFTEVVREGDRERYYTIHPVVNYVGKHTGVHIEGWGKEMKEKSYFINEEGKQVVVNHTNTTAFYHVALPSYDASGGAPPAYQAACDMPINSCKACKQVGHRIHTCPNEKERQRFYDQTKPKEYFVVRRPSIDKYYEATFWDRREGPWDNERHFAKETTKREYVGKYVRHKQQGYGDGADHWAVFLRDGKEIEIEYDYDGKRAWYEVPEQQTK
jgi:hypothetical protein